MVVFGAGASYDSAPSHPPPGHGHPDPVGAHRLPLADALFEERDLFASILEQFRPAQDVVPRLRHLQKGETVESVMETLEGEAATDPRRHRQLAAVRYYLQAALFDCEYAWRRYASRGVTNYKGLLDAIEHARKADEVVCLVSFNYDTMLEEALPTVGVEIRSIGDYVASKAYKVIKLHGSINWGREFEPTVGHVQGLGDQQLIAELIAGAATLRVTDRYHVVANQHPIVRLDMARPLVPAIAIPVQSKGAFECPENHVAALRACLPNVRKLLVIGWQATDAPFLDLLRDPGRQGMKGLVVAGRREWAMPVINTLTRSLDRPGEFQPATGGFTDFIVRHEVEAFLGAA
jgi:hypothetical protein